MISLLFLVIINVFNIDYHDLHLSKTEVYYNHENKSIEISLHLFIDDLESALKLLGHENLLICTEKEDTKAEDYIQEYVNNLMKIDIDSRNISYDFIGKEASEDLMGVYCYMEIPHVEPTSSISVAIDFFNELYDDQKNVVKIEFDKDRNEYFLLNRTKKKAELSINDE